MVSQQAQKSFQKDLVKTQVRELPTSKIINIEDNTRSDQNDALSPWSPGPRPTVIIDSPPRTNKTRKLSADSESKRQDEPYIKQEPVDVDALGYTPSKVLSVATIKHDPSHGNDRNAKRVRFEEAENNDDHVDMYQIEELKRQEPNVIEEEDLLAEQQLMDQEQTAMKEVGSAQPEHVAEDELSEEERRIVAEENAKSEEELEEAQRQLAEMI